jgi:hypothetical protein
MNLAKKYRPHRLPNQVLVDFLPSKKEFRIRLGGEHLLWESLAPQSLSNRIQMLAPVRMERCRSIG